MTEKSKKNVAKASGTELDAIALLKADHRAVEVLFAQYETARSSSQKAKLAKKICLELSVHTAIEEELLYTACRGEVDGDLLDEAYVEHDGAKALIAELLAGSPDESFYDAKVKVLSEMIKHHVKEEEQRDGLFAQAKSAGINLGELGVRLNRRKREMTTEFAKGGVPAPTTRSMKGSQVILGEPLERTEANQ